MIEVGWHQLSELCLAAVAAAGGDERTAAALSDAVLSAERRGNSAVGVAHLFDYLDALEAGRLNGTPEPTVRNSRSAVLLAAADDGTAQLAYAVARSALLTTARQCGVCVLSVSGSFTVGELGYYTTDVAEQGLVCLAVANSPALMSLYNVPAALSGTNPFSFALPGRPAPRLIDQASSAVAWVRVRDAAAAGKPIPLGWALDADGSPTTDSAAALLGPLLPFGGVKGSNIALTIELLSVLSGAAFSMDAPDFSAGQHPPRVGLFLVALDPAAFAADYLDRVEQHLERLRAGFGIDFGRRYALIDQVELPDDVYHRLCDAAGRSPE